VPHPIEPDYAEMIKRWLALGLSPEFLPEIVSGRT
jgi:hypothetical protein